MTFSGSIQIEHWKTVKRRINGTNILLWIAKNGGFFNDTIKRSEEISFQALKLFFHIRMDFNKSEAATEGVLKNFTKFTEKH